jgi:energy-coupling factor transporter ATP-binding protein EcfA2
VKERVSLALHLTEAQHLARRPIHHLSGGEMKRVALAGLIAMRSPLLILDEPQNALDPASSEHLIELVEHLHQDHGYAFLTVTHKMDYVPRLAERVIVMDQGHVLADGPVRQVLTDVNLMERARLAAPSITRYFYEKARKEGKEPKDLPLTVEEALKLEPGA